MRQLKITKQVTNRETASLDKYLQEIGKVELITADEEVILAQKIREFTKENNTFCRKNVFRCNLYDNPVVYVISE